MDERIITMQYKTADNNSFKKEMTMFAIDFARDFKYYERYDQNEWTGALQFFYCCHLGDDWDMFYNIIEKYCSKAVIENLNYDYAVEDLIRAGGRKDLIDLRDYAFTQVYEDGLLETYEHETIESLNKKKHFGFVAFADNNGEEPKDND